MNKASGPRMFHSFIKLLRTLLWLAVAVALVSFAIGNRGLVTLSLPPFAAVLTLPVWAVLFGGILLGLLMAGLVTGKLRLENFAARRRAERKAEDLDKRVTALSEDAHSVAAKVAHDAASGKAALVTDKSSL